MRDEFTSVLAVSSSRSSAAIAETSADTAAKSIGEGKVVLGILEKLEHESLDFVADIAVVFLVEALGQNSVREFALVAPVVYTTLASNARQKSWLDLERTVVGQKREILSLRIASRNRGDLGSRRVDPGLLAEQIIGDLGITNPDVHLTADGGAEDTVVLIAELLHRKPREPLGSTSWIASNVGDGAGGTRAGV